MNVTERDQLLIRLDERSHNTWRSVEKIEKHQSEQNGFIQDNILSTQRNTTWRKVITPIVGGVFLVITGILMKILLGG